VGESRLFTSKHLPSGSYEYNVRTVLCLYVPVKTFFYEYMPEAIPTDSLAPLEGAGG